MQIVCNFIEILLQPPLRRVYVSLLVLAIPNLGSYLQLELRLT